MKKAICFATFMAAGIGAAHAQSSVTLYGRIAAGVDFVDNVATTNGQSSNLYRFGSNQYGISWWGLTGTEDLGGGLHAEFKLESAFTSGTGQVGQSLFNRFAYVGLDKDGWGSLWAGQVMSLTDETGFYLDPLGQQSIGIANFAKGRAYGSRSNTITYNSPKWAGFSFRLQNGFGNEAGNFRGSRQFSGSATYALGGFNAYGVYEEIRDENGKFTNPYVNSREYMIGGTYQFSALKFYAGYQALVSSGSDTIASTTNPFVSTRSQQEWFGASYQINPALAVAAGYYHGNANHGGGSGNLGVIGTTYNLSKRTFVYATFGAMFNGKDSNWPVETADSLPLAGHNQQGGYVGMMHTF
jgi:predicted porin